MTNKELQVAATEALNKFKVPFSAVLVTDESIQVVQDGDHDAFAVIIKALESYNLWEFDPAGFSGKTEEVEPFGFIYTTTTLDR